MQQKQVEDDERISQLEHLVLELQLAPGKKALNISEKIKFVILSLLITFIISQGLNSYKESISYAYIDDRKGKIVNAIKK